MTGGGPAPLCQDPLALALALDRRVAAAGALETIAIPGGQVLLNAELPQIRFLNELVLDAPLTIDAGELTALADSWLGHLSPHQLVDDDDEDSGLQSMCEYLANVAGAR